VQIPVKSWSTVVRFVRSILNPGARFAARATQTDNMALALYLPTAGAEEVCQTHGDVARAAADVERIQGHRRRR
jgi:hypothetical protein